MRSDIFERRISKLFEKLEKSGIDILVTINVEGSDTANARYLSGFTGSFCILLIGKNERMIITDSRYYDQALNETTFELVKLDGKDYEDLMKSHIKSKMRIGMNFSRISHNIFLKLQEKFRDVEFIDVKDVLDELRMVKDGYEIERIKISAKISKDAFLESLNYLKPGMSEREFAAILECEMKKKGAEKIAFETIVASGPRSALPHGIASDKKIEYGEMVVIDFGAVFDGYVSDLTRTVFVGEVSKEQVKIYEIVKKAQRTAISKIKAGMKGMEMDGIARDVIEKEGYGDEFGHGLGHGIGLEVHEMPKLSPKSKDIIPSGVTVTVEPGIYIHGKFGVRIEDDILITENGVELLSEIDEIIKV